MKNFLSMKAALLILLLHFIISMSCCATGSAAEHSFKESFNTTANCSTANTTAWWDISSGELKLYPFDIEIITHVEIYGGPWQLAVHGDYMYVADGHLGIKIFEISDPESLVLVAVYDTPGSACDVKVHGDILYVTDIGSGVLVLDISNPQFPVYSNNVYTSDSPYHIEILGDNAFVSNWADSTVTVLDIVDPANPIMISEVEEPGRCDANSCARRLRIYCQLRQWIISHEYF